MIDAVTTLRRDALATRVREPAWKAAEVLRIRRRSRAARAAELLDSLGPGLAAAALARRRRIRLGKFQVGREAPTPFGAALRGAGGGLAGNAAMGAAQWAAFRVRGKETGGWTSWEDAPAPAKIGKRVWEGVFRRQAPVERIRLFNNVVHWTYGALLAAAFGVVEASRDERRPVRDGLAFGAAAWILGSGALMPAAKLAKPPWRYGVGTNALDAGYHLAYGLATAGTFRALERV